MHKSDQEIQSAVEQVLAGSSRVDKFEVHVAVSDSTVTLTGAVDSAKEKRTARQLAEEIEGVKSVIDDMTVKDFVKRPDDELVQEVRNRLLRDAFVEDGVIEVYASNGEIQLDGSVPDYHTKKAAEDVAWWTPGVINVENLLLVSGEEFVDVTPLAVTDAS